VDKQRQESYLTPVGETKNELVESRNFLASRSMDDNDCWSNQTQQHAQFANVVQFFV